MKGLGWIKELFTDRGGNVDWEWEIFMSSVLVSFNRRKFDSSQKLICLMQFERDKLESGLELIGNFR